MFFYMLGKRRRSSVFFILPVTLQFGFQLRTCEGTISFPLIGYRVAVGVGGGWMRRARGGDAFPLMRGSPLESGTLNTPCRSDLTVPVRILGMSFFKGESLRMTLCLCLSFKFFSNLLITFFNLEGNLSGLCKVFAL